MPFAAERCTRAILGPPYHPYTRLLITSVPEVHVGWLEGSAATREAAAGIARDVELLVRGCPFFGRCPIAIEGTCDAHFPPVIDYGKDHLITCHNKLTTQ